MIPHEIIEPLSIEWLTYNLLTLIIIIGLLFLGSQLSSNNKNRLTRWLGIIFILEFVCMEIIHIKSGTWSIQDSLPLHLCSIMWFLSIYLFLYKKQWAFEIILFIGLPGGLHSLLTPELTHGSDIIHKIDFFIGHGGLVLAPLYAIFILKMWPRKLAWLYSFLKLQILVVFVGICNYLFESNYMYLSSTPIANNPLIPSENSIFGHWPYYIFIFELLIIIHAIIINIPFWMNKKYSES